MTLDATNSEDTDGSIQEYIWSVSETSVSVTGATQTVTIPVSGTYGVELTVTDDDIGIGKFLVINVILFSFGWIFSVLIIKIGSNKEGREGRNVSVYQ